MKVYRGVDAYRSHFLDLGTSWTWMVSFTLRPLYFRGRSRGTHWIGGWSDPRAGLDDVEKRKFLILPGLELQLLVVSRYTDYAITAPHVLHTNPQNHSFWKVYRSASFSEMIGVKLHMKWNPPDPIFLEMSVSGTSRSEHTPRDMRSKSFKHCASCLV
jgi:hypothetical protein